MIGKSFRLLAHTFVLLTSLSPAHAADERLTIGVVPEINLVKQMNRYTPLCRYLSRKAGVHIELKPVGNYGRIYEKMRDGDLDGGFFGSFVYVMTRARLGIEPLARPQAPGGVSTYTGLTFVRKDSGIRRAEDMRGKTIALVDPATTAGYLAQKHFLSRHGINIDRDMKIIWRASHDEVMTAVMQREADIGGAKNIPVQRLRRENKAFADAITVLDETPKIQVPENALAVRKDLPPAVKARLKKVILSMHNDPEGRQVLEKFGAARFIDTKDSDYQPLYNLVTDLKINLLTYPYRKP